ncbi:unnamed protein product [Dovyalis caffra]|uniref:Uncharacterized protein n=1 Tax=Dovyalis caffra TaxID=77055 RepID=A0AAV1QVB4_9ROSI|nr:unnamed protein product [Dovyalis caffra]
MSFTRQWLHFFLRRVHSGVNPPPVPTPPTDNYGVGLIHDAAGSSQQAHDEGQPGSSHLAPHQREVGQNKLVSILEQHLRTHCSQQAITEKDPQVKNWTQEDFHYLAQHMAISEFDSDTKTNNEMGDLAKHIRPYKRVKTLLDQYLDKRFSDD